jgi:hypothetical protein
VFYQPEVDKLRSMAAVSCLNTADRHYFGFLNEHCLEVDHIQQVLGERPKKKTLGWGGVLTVAKNI